MKIISLDLSTHSSGWAFFEGETLKDYGCITATSSDLINRIEKITKELKEILDKYNSIDKIILEEVRPEGRGYGVGNLQTHRALMWLQAAVAFLIHDNYNHIEIVYVYPSSWRATIGIQTGRGIKRAELKKKDIAFVEEKYSIKVNDDIADAIGIGLSQIKREESDLNWE